MRISPAVLTVLLSVAVPPSAAPLAQAHGSGPLLMTEVSHADPRSIDRVPELPAPRANTTGEVLAGAARAAATPLAILDAHPVLWCGPRRSSDYTTTELQNGPYRYHAIYAIPQGATDRFTVVAGTLQADVFQASALIEQLYRRSIRLDMGTACGQQYLDISVVRLPQTAAALSALAARDSTGLLNTVAAGLAAAGFDPMPAEVTFTVAAAKTTNYLVWLEDVTASAGVCGVGGQYDDTRRDFSNLNNFGGKLAVVMRDGAGFCNSNTIRHEIGHNLGALLPGAPNAFDGAHCDDAYEDTMCYPQARTRGGGSYQRQFFDFGNDDYWDPPGGALPWWTVNLSRFLCPNIVCNVPEEPGLASRLLGAVGEILNPRELLTSCPIGSTLGVDLACKANSAAGTGVARRPAPSPTIVFRARRAGAGRWRVSMRVKGEVRARVTVRCRRGSRTVRALERRISFRRTSRATVRCDSRPRASAVLA